MKLLLRGTTVQRLLMSLGTLVTRTVPTIVSRTQGWLRGGWVLQSDAVTVGAQTTCPLPQAFLPRVQSPCPSHRTGSWAQPLEPTWGSAWGSRGLQDVPEPVPASGSSRRAQLHRVSVRVTVCMAEREWACWTPLQSTSAMEIYFLSFWRLKPDRGVARTGFFLWLVDGLLCPHRVVPLRLSLISTSDKTPVMLDLDSP